MQTLSSNIGSEGQFTILYNNKSIDERKALAVLERLSDGELAQILTYKEETVNLHGAPKFTVSPKHSKWEIEIVED